LQTESSDQTIRRILSRYQIGQELRKLRLRKKIGLVELAERTGLSASMLSQLETGKLIPTLPTLMRIAETFGVELDHFFSAPRTKSTFSIIRADERIRFPEIGEAASPHFYFEVLAFGVTEKTISPYLAEFPKNAVNDTAEHVHDGFELIYVIEGVLVLTYKQEHHGLRAGDAVCFDASELHSYHGDSEPAAKAIVVTFPSGI
jgi:transcriptional regulator with XRE-family HTH domain